MKRITANELKQKLDRKEDMVLINVLDPSDFEQEHVPGSVNVPTKQPDFVAQVEPLAARKDRQIIVYCSNEQCPASPEAGRKLEAAGFTNVSHYAGGMDGWKTAGFPVEHGALTSA